MPRLLFALACSALVLVPASALASPSATVLRISADAKGALRYDKTLAESDAGRVTIVMKNPSLIPHNVAVRGSGVRKLGKVVLKGGTSTVTATLKAGRYVFFCSVAGHERAGMKGVLIVG
ncbi:MAG: plastocyanin/azurin family copper-binding protein [Gaiellaceae bacterium]